MPHLKAEIVPKGQNGRPLHMLGSHPPGPESVWIIGSDPAQCDICVQTPLVCPRQTRLIQHDPSRWEIVCIGGENGTFLNRRRITRAELHSGDEVRTLTEALVVKDSPATPHKADVGAVAYARSAMNAAHPQNETMHPGAASLPARCIRLQVCAGSMPTSGSSPLPPPATVDRFTLNLSARLRRLSRK